MTSPFLWLCRCLGLAMVFAAGVGSGVCAGEDLPCGISFVPRGKTFEGLAKFEYWLGVDPKTVSGTALRSAEFEIRAAKGNVQIARLSYDCEISRDVKDQRMRRREGMRMGISGEDLRRIGELPPGEYHMAFLLNGRRASNVVAFRIDPGFDAAKAPTFEFGVLEPHPLRKRSVPILWVIGPTPPDTRISNFSVYGAGLNVDGVERKREMIVWTGPVGLIQNGDRFSFLPEPGGYVPPFDPDQPRTYGFNLAGLAAKPLWVDPAEAPLGEAWDKAVVTRAPQRPAIVRGTVTGPDGKPAAGYFVWLQTPVHTAAEEVTDEAGRYSFSGSMHPGIYKLCVSESRAKQTPFRETFVLTHNDDATRDFDLRKPPSEEKKAELPASPPGLRYIDLKKVEQQVGKGLDVNQRSQDGNTPLSMAALTGRFELVKKLVEAGADVNAKVGTRSTVLGEAIRGGKPEIVEFLLEKGADANKVFPENGTPLLEAARQGRVVIARALLEAGANPRAKTTGGQNAVALGAKRGDPDIITLFAARGVDVNLMDEDGRTPLIWAAMGGYAEAVEALIDGGADVNFANQDGFTALFAAAAGQSAERNFEGVVKALLAAGAKPSPSTVMGDTPFSKAAYAGALGTLRLLATAGAEVRGEEGRKAMNKAIHDKDYALLAELMKLGANPDQIIGFQMPAIFNGLSDPIIVQILVEAKADVNVTKREFANEITPLIWASREGHSKVVEVLLKAGADVHYRDLGGRTALDAAIEARKPEVEKLLRATGAKPGPGTPSKNP